MPCDCKRTLGVKAAEMKGETYCPRCGRPFSDDDLQQKLDTLLEGAAQELYDRVVALARQALHEDSSLLSFCMAMGSVSFKADRSWEEDGERVERIEHEDAIEIGGDSASIAELQALMPLVHDLCVSGMPAKIDGKDAPLLKHW